MENLETDVVIAGAGLAGLTAARRLRQHGVEVVVLEARPRVGGRTLNHPIGDGKVVEVGGQWVGPTQHRVQALLDELGLMTFETYDQGRRLFEHGNRLRPYRGDIPRVSPLALLDTQLALTKLERMAATVSPETPWTARHAAKWDAQTLASWTKRTMMTTLGRSLIGLACEAVWAADAADVSLLHLLAYARSGGSLQALISTEGGAQQSRVVGGSQCIALAMAKQLGDAVHVDQAVHRIEIEEHGAAVRVHGDTTSVQAKRVVVAMSPALAGRLTYQPSLPGLRDQLTQRMPNGSVIKCMALYDEPFWRERDLSGQVTSDRGPVKVVFDNSPPDGRPGVLLGFLEGNQARLLGTRSAEERRDAVVSCFRRFFGDKAAKPYEYVEKNWTDDEWTRGCYGAFMPPNTWLACGQALRQPVGSIYWAGAETATEWMGYMDGAVGSGVRVADEVIAGLSLPKR